MHFLELLGVPPSGWTLCLLLGLLYLWGRWRLRRRRRGEHGALGPRRFATVYVFHDTECPHLFKVGMTRRLTKVRMAEVSRAMADRAPLLQVYAVEMHFARAVEHEAHRLLQRYRARWKRGSSRGTEWFALRRWNALGTVTSAVEQAAWTVRTRAIRQGRWSDAMDVKARKTWSKAGSRGRASLFT
jgi:hypothetical protein